MLRGSNRLVAGGHDGRGQLAADLRPGPLRAPAFESALAAVDGEANAVVQLPDGRLVDDRRVRNLDGVPQLVPERDGLARQALPAVDLDAEVPPPAAEVVNVSRPVSPEGSTSCST